LSPSPEVDEGLPENLQSAIAVVSQEGINNGFYGHIEREEIECAGKSERQPNVDDEDGEESTPKSSDESDNPSVGVEASGSDSANADDSAEERDDDEHEGKNESEGDAEGEGMVDAEGEGTSLASSEKLLLSCMPLTTHPPSSVPNSAASCDSSIFYGNDTLYVLFRLHQVRSELNCCAFLCVSYCFYYKDNLPYCRHYMIAYMLLKFMQ
jgi:hypothetical protein